MVCTRITRTRTFSVAEQRFCFVNAAVHLPKTHLLNKQKIPHLVGGIWKYINLSIRFIRVLIDVCVLVCVCVCVCVCLIYLLLDGYFPSKWIFISKVQCPSKTLTHTIFAMGFAFVIELIACLPSNTFINRIIYHFHVIPFPCIIHNSIQPFKMINKHLQTNTNRIRVHIFRWTEFSCQQMVANWIFKLSKWFFAGAWIMHMGSLGALINVTMFSINITFSHYEMENFRH